MPRLLVGIDRPASKSQVADYVLSNFSASEKDLIKQTISDCIKVLSDELNSKYRIRLLQKKLENEGGWLNAVVDPGGIDKLV